jgi:O-antigen/teichoic acid export membrane protein
VAEVEQREVTPGDDSSNKRLETRILRGSVWLAFGFGGRQVITWLSMLVLVRLLDPETFGLMALAFTVVSALEYLRGSGIYAALIYRRTEIEEAAASAFVYLIASSAVVYGACFAFAPLAAHLFHASDLTGVLRAFALVLIIGGFSTVPAALLQRELKFAAVVALDLGAACIQVAAAIGLAVAGAGVWSLVIGQLAAGVLEAAALWYIVGWPSPRRASWPMMRELFHYGRFAGAANLATFVGGTVDTVAVGRILGATATGFYSVSFRLATMPESLIHSIIVKAMFPAFSIVQDDREAFRRTFVRHSQRVALFVLPTTIFIVLAAKPIVLALLGEKWLTVVTPLRILAAFGFIRALSATTGSVFRGTGRPQLAMWFAILNVALLVPALILLVPPLELTGASIAVLTALGVATLPAMVQVIRMVGLSAGDLVQTVQAPLVCSAILALVLAVLLSMTQDARPAVALIVLLIGGVACYVASIALFARSVVVPMWLDLRGTRT